MDRDTWARVRQLFDAAIDLTDTARADLLDRECAGDVEVRRAVDDLLVADAEQGRGSTSTSGASTHPSEHERDAKADARALHIGSRFGAYRIIRELGHGGMGTVFLAERVDGEFTQVVALKIVRRTWVDTESIRRFRLERQVLASLEHPNIARLLDGGVSEAGEPYLVMEYVPGEPIVGFAERRRQPLRERLLLFAKVCRALAYAQSRLVVHRDIKPSNILVTEDGEPKLIDFGLAKLLEPAGTTDADSATVTQFQALTPAYASPEQFFGKSITTASDVYSLGVVLFELLTGARPFDVSSGSPVDVLRTLETRAPERPSAVVARRTASRQSGEHNDRSSAFVISADLDNIVLMALRREPERRYSSASALAADIDLYLDGRPVYAHPSTWSYRARKWFSRNRVAAVAATLTLAAIVGGLGVSVREARIALAERDRATRRFADVRRLSNSLLFELSPRIERMPGATAARDVLVSRAVEYLDSLAAESPDDQELQLELAAAYEKVGDLQGNPTNPNLAELDASVASYLKARHLREGAERLDGRNTAKQRLLAENFRILGNVYSQANDFERAAHDLNEALQYYERVAGDASADAAVRLGFAQTLHDVGRHQSNSSRYAAAIAPFTRAVSVTDAVLREHPGDVEATQLLAETESQLGLALSWEGRQADAEAQMRRAAEVSEALLATHPDDVVLRNSVWSVYWLTSSVYEEQRDDLAQTFALKALDVIQRIVASDPDNIRARQQLAKSYSRLGQTTVNIGQSATALGYLREAATILDAIASGESRNGRLRSELALALTRLADARKGQGQLDAALADAGRAADIYKDVLATFPSDRRSARNLVLTNQTLGEIHEQLAARGARDERGRHQRLARASYERALATLTALRDKETMAETDGRLLQALQARVAAFAVLRDDDE